MGYAAKYRSESRANIVLYSATRCRNRCDNLLDMHVTNFLSRAEAAIQGALNNKVIINENELNPRRAQAASVLVPRAANQATNLEDLDIQRQPNANDAMVLDEQATAALGGPSALRQPDTGVSNTMSDAAATVTPAALATSPAAPGSTDRRAEGVLESRAATAHTASDGVVEEMEEIWGRGC